MTAKAFGAGARVVAGFKDNFWETFDEPVEDEGMMRDVHLASDDEQAKGIVSGLVDDLGFRAIDCGALKNARALDAMAPLLVELDRRYTGGSRRSMWKFVEDTRG
jgi:predicted dinucleotide-binding enzyme